MSDEYKVCPKCQIRHSVYVKHICSDAGEAKPPEFDDAPPGDEEGDGDAKSGEGQGEGQSDDQSEGEGQGEGEGEGEGDEDGEGEGESEGQAPEPKPPEPEAPPVAVVVSVLKFAALTADCSEAFVKIELGEHGLMIVAIKGDDMATATVPWGEFEQRSTLDGEYYVKETIDATAREVLEKHDARHDGPTDEAPPEAEPLGAKWTKWRGQKAPVDGDIAVDVALYCHLEKPNRQPPRGHATDARSSYCYGKGACNWSWLTAENEDGRSGSIAWWRLAQ